MNTGFRRPGVSDQFLATAKCHHVGSDECMRLYGFRAEGIAIPFYNANGVPVMDNDKAFARVRLYATNDSQKYHQRTGSGVHIYVPPRFAESTKRSRLILVEGEFKSLALAEEGYTALGLCGITGAARTIKGEDGDRDYEINNELLRLLKMHEPAQVIFLGDSDVVLNAAFSVEAAKLRPLIFGSKDFKFVERLTVAKIPLGTAKGVDDLRAERADDFKDCFEAIISNGYDLPPKATGTEVFGALLKAEIDSVKQFLSQQDHEGSRARHKLLQSAALLWKEPGAKLELKPILSRALGVSESEVTGLVRDAAPPRNEGPRGTANLNLPGSQTRAIEPWDEAVVGHELLDELRETYRRFVVLPPHADVLLAAWTLHTYVFEMFSFTPYFHIVSPEKECGKSTLAELMNHLCANATTPGGMSAAAMFRRIESRKPTLLLDEWDTLSDENRQAALNSLNTGFKWNGVYTICVGDHHEDRDFHTYCPKAIFGLSEAKLPDATRSRCFVLVLQKKLATELVEKLTRKFDGSVLRRKCLRWANDNRDKLTADTVMPHGLSARQEDISEPLLSIADLSGRQWPVLVRDAILHFCGEAKSEDGDLKRELLKDIREFSKQSQTDRFTSAALCDYLNGLEHRQWADWNEGKGIRQRQISDRLRTYRIAPHNIKVDGKVPKGYYLSDFEEAFDRYLPPENDSTRYPATNPENIEHSQLFRSATLLGGSGCKNNGNSNEIRDSSGVADSKEEPEVMLL